MGLITLQEILKVEEGSAVAAVGTTDYLMAEAILSAAEEAGSPVIIMIGSLIHKPYAPYVIPAIAGRCRASTIPAALHLDHGTSIEAAERAIRYGCSSVMFDGSALPIDENIALTNRVVEFSRAAGVSVEAEIGHVSGPEGTTGKGMPDSAKYTRVEDAVRFADSTQIDALAVAFGTVHGLFREEPKLDFDRLEAISKAVDLPLVLHGSTGLPADDIRHTISLGVKKVNIFTGLMIAAGAAAGDMYNSGERRYPGLTQAAFAAAVGFVKEQLTICNTTGTV